MCADFALHIVCELARAELGEIDAIAGAQAAGLAFVIRTLRRITPRLVDEGVPNDKDDACLLGPAAIELVKVGRIFARLGAALRACEPPKLGRLRLLDLSTRLPAAARLSAPRCIRQRAPKTRISRVPGERHMKSSS